LRVRVGVLVVLVLLLSVTAAVWFFYYAPGALLNPLPLPLKQGYTIVDEKTGESLAYVGVRASVGDQLITWDNRLYVVVRVTGHTAFARYQGKLSP